MCHEKSKQGSVKLSLGTELYNVRGGLMKLSDEGP